ncbi:hypothetical protein L1887_29129 [Cichorium endivia]|nr:hypothetical protein L1887_29129 [Cichorium endivia]
MFKSARWRSDKNKIKAVFKLQFHATQLTQIGGDALMIAVIPGDVGKPTARLDKAKVRDGSCYWEKPHYETLKFIQDQKTGKFNEKIYRFVVATGSSAFGVVGEVSLDFASYAEATKLSSISLPLKNAKSTSLLHVSIQRVQDQREVDESENANVENTTLTVQLSNGDMEGNIQVDPGEDHVASNGSDITMSCSDSSSGVDTPRDPEPKNTNKLARESSTTTIYEEQHRKSSSQWDWLDGSPHDHLSTDDSSVISSREIPDDGSPDAIIKKLQTELAVFVRQADMSEMELQTLRKQIVKETKKSQTLSQEVACLKEERDVLKEECAKMKEAYWNSSEVKVNGNSGGDPWALIDVLKQELSYEKDLNSDLRLQLQKTQESNAELILAVRDLDEMLEQKGSVTSIAPKSQEVNSKSETDDDEDQKALEEIVREHSGLKDAYLQEQKIIDLYNEIELYKRDKEEIETQMEQIALDYEILKQENHDIYYKLEQSQLQEQLKMQYECSTPYDTVNELESQIENLDNELKMKSKELEKSSLVIKELETHVKNLEEDLENQALGFEADMEDLVRAKVEQEQRAIRSEENLRKVKLQNANTAGKLQEEFRRLSTEMTSAFKENENAAMKAMDEAQQLQIEKRHLEEMLKEVQEELQYLRDQYEERLVDLSNHINLKSKQLKEMEQQIEHCGDKIQKLESKNKNLEDERKNLENEVRLVKMELESSRKELSELRNVKKDKENEVERLQSEIERLKSRCNDMKQFLKENELEKENLKKKVLLLNSDLKKKDETISSLDKKLKDGSKTNLKNIKSVPTRGPKEVTNMKDRIKLLEAQIKLKETALEISEASFLEKEKDLQQKIEELERRLEVLDQDTENPQVSTAESSNPAIKSDDAIKHEINKTGDQEIFETLLNRNKSMEVELKEMQERYSEISLKFAEVEGERQQLVMSLRNLKNAKK